MKLSIFATKVFLSICVIFLRGWRGIEAGLLLCDNRGRSGRVLCGRGVLARFGLGNCDNDFFMWGIMALRRWECRV